MGKPLSWATSLAYSCRSGGTASAGHFPGQWRRQTLYSPSPGCTVSQSSVGVERLVGSGVEVGRGVSVDRTTVDSGGMSVVKDGVMAGVAAGSAIGSAVPVGGGAAQRSNRARAPHPTPHATAPNRTSTPTNRMIRDLGLGIWGLRFATIPSPPQSLRCYPPRRRGWPPRPGHRRPSADCAHLRRCAGSRHPKPSPTAHQSTAPVRRRPAVAA
jgi:hypothetical protein